MSGQTEKEYTGTCYVGVVGGETEIGPCRDSIEKIVRRPGDSPLQFYRATKGYEARQKHVNNFIKSHHDFILLLDHDMAFPVNTLEKLRSHKLPYVSGFYMRRLTEVVSPIWFRPFEGKFPMEPWVGKVVRGRLHEIGASGWGCMLMHRDVVLGVRALLKGEYEVLEDDMDIYPYDLKRIAGALNGLQEHLNDCKEGRRKAHPITVQAFVDILVNEIRPLRCDNEPIGSDIRFPFFALQAGYQLMGDPDVSCGHIVNYPMSLNDYEAFTDEQLGKARKELQEHVESERVRIQQQIAEVIHA